VAKFAASTGELKWINQVGRSNSQISDLHSACMADSGEITVLANSTDPTGRSLMAKLRASDGAVLWTSPIALTLEQRFGAYGVPATASVSWGDAVVYDGFGYLYRVSATDGAVPASRAISIATAQKNFVVEDDHLFLIERDGTSTFVQKIAAGDFTNVFSQPLNMADVQSLPSGVRLLSPGVIGWLEQHKDDTFWVQAASSETGQLLWRVKLAPLGDLDAYALEHLDLAGTSAGTVYVGGGYSKLGKFYAFTQALDGPHNKRLWQRLRPESSFGFFVTPVSTGVVTTYMQAAAGDGSKVKAILYSNGG
jgi:outer membrane protein assembly factor BamB